METIKTPLFTGFPNVLHAKQFTLAFITEVLAPEARRMRELIDAPGGHDQLRQELRHKILLSHFYEPSTRTRLSFEFAALHLGMHVLTTENAGEFSSAAKGETVAHSLKVISLYRPDVIVMRHKQDGIASHIASHSRVPLINGGDGRDQHPTQALLDIFTIFDEMGTVEDLTIGYGGDLAYSRVVRSGIFLLAKSKRIKFILASDPRFRLGEDLKAHLQEHGVEFQETESMEYLIRRADVVYWTRTQTERIEDEALKADTPAIQQRFTIGLEEVSWMKPGAILMHPMPIVWEIKEEVEDHPQALYLKQVENGLFVRMALLKLILG